MNRIISLFLPLIDILIVPLLYPAAWLLEKVRYAGIHNLPLCKKVLLKIGVFPIRTHYYEPRFDYRNLKKPLTATRDLTGIDWNVDGQLQMLDTFTFANELDDITKPSKSPLQYCIYNIPFGPGDGEYWYQLIRHFKPRRIIEIGSGQSTLVAIKAIKKNNESESDYSCTHTCIEPYEMLWLEQTGVKVIREKVEDLPVNFFSELEENDILFIDSSHIIKPQGDVLFEYLEVLPSLKKGVIVHVHDIFSPGNYLKHVLEELVQFWNEQYLLEAFLSHNSDWKILGALNYLHHNHFDKLKKVAPYLTPDKDPGSFYMQKIA